MRRSGLAHREHERPEGDAVATVSTAVRFTAKEVCPICGGYEAMPRGQGKRCAGFLSGDRRYAHCSRGEHAGGLSQEGGGTYAHRLDGPCKCGVTHGSFSTNGHAPVDAPKTRYDYRDADGKLLARHVRRDYPSGQKQMWWELPDGRASKNGAIKPESLPLYGLADVLSATADQPIVLVEGEKAADAAKRAGLLAASLAGGASQQQFGTALAPLAGREVWLWPDADAPGRTLMQYVAGALAGRAARVRWLEPSGLPAKGDAFDYFAAGRAVADLTPTEPTAADADERPRIISARDLMATTLPPTNWAVEGILPEGVLLWCGRPKQGKSWLALNVCIAVAAGGMALGHMPVTRGRVLYIALEDNAQSLQERLSIVLAGEAPPEGLDLLWECPRAHEGGVDLVADWITAHADARLVVIDTLQRFRAPTNGKQGVYEQDYEAFGALLKLCKRTRITIAFIHHVRKGEAEDPFDTISGSNGLIGSADGGWVLQRVRGQSSATLYMRGRRIPEQTLGLEWDEQICSWRYAGSGDDVRLTQDRRMVLDALRDDGAPMDARTIADAVGRPYENVRQMLYHMSRAGLVLMGGDKRYSLPASANNANDPNGPNSANSANGRNAGSDARRVSAVSTVSTSGKGVARCGHCGGELREGWCPVHKYEV